MEIALPNIDKKYFVDIDNYIKIRDIGCGGFGRVLLVQEKSTSKIYAAKILKFSGDGEIRVNEEIEILAKNEYPSLVKLQKFSPIDFYHENKFTIIMDYYPNGSVPAYMHENKLTNTNKYIYLLGVAISVRYLHNHHICHRDLKPENILLDENLYPIVSDFGVSRETESTTTQNIFQTCVGTPNFMAPEMLQGEDYSYRVDSYSFAMITYHIILEEVPFGKVRINYKFMQDVDKGIRPDTRKIANSYVVGFIEQCWANNPADRLSFNDIVNYITNPEFYSFFEGLEIEKVKEYLDIFGNEYEYLKEKFTTSTSSEKVPSSVSIEKVYSFVPTERVSSSVPPEKDDHYHDPSEKVTLSIPTEKDDDHLESSEKVASSVPSEKDVDHHEPSDDDDDTCYNERDMTEDDIDFLTTTLHVSPEEVADYYRRAQQTKKIMSAREYNCKVEWLMDAVSIERHVAQTIFEFADHSIHTSLAIFGIFTE